MEKSKKTLTQLIVLAGLAIMLLFFFISSLVQSSCTGCVGCQSGCTGCASCQECGSKQEKPEKQEASSSDVTLSPEKEESAAKITEGSLVLMEGEQAELEFIAGDGAIWNSTDEQTATCENGIVTAHRSGTAVISLVCGGSFDSVEVTVTGNLTAELEECLKSIAYENGDADRLNMLQSRMEISGRADLEGAAAVVNELFAYAAGSGEAQQLYAAAEKSGI